MTDAGTPRNIFHIGFGFWASKVLLSGVETRLFTELAKGPADLVTLSQRLGACMSAPPAIFSMHLSR